MQVLEVNVSKIVVEWNFCVWRAGLRCEWRCDMHPALCDLCINLVPSRWGQGDSRRQEERRAKGLWVRPRSRCGVKRLRKTQCLSNWLGLRKDKHVYQPSTNTVQHWATRNYEISHQVLVGGDKGQAHTTHYRAFERNAFQWYVRSKVFSLPLWTFQ